MSVTFGPQSPGWDPAREQERVRERARIDALVMAAGVVETADGDVNAAIWQDLDGHLSGVHLPTLSRYGPQNALWDPRREQMREQQRLHAAQLVEAARVVAGTDGDATTNRWREFELQVGSISEALLGAPITLF